MRLHSEESGMKWWLRVWILAIVGGLLVLLMLAAVACEDTEPTATVEPTLPVPLVDATDVEVVYASPAYPLP